MEQEVIMRIIGFGQEESKPRENRLDVTVTTDAPVRSLVSISFERMNRALTYYNDQFDLLPPNSASELRTIRK